MKPHAPARRVVLVLDARTPAAPDALTSRIRRYRLARVEPLRCGPTEAVGLEHDGR